MKKLIVLATLTLLLELSGLVILNNFIFVNSSEFKSNKMELKKDISKDIKATIKNEESDINLSYKGRYLAYYKEDKLYIQDSKTGKERKIETEDDEKIMYYRWLDKRDLIAIVEKVKKSGEDKLQLITYNPINDSKTSVQEICSYEKNMKVNNMTLSVLTNVYYIDVDKGGLKNTVYRIDINNDIKKVNIKADILGNMQVIPHEDRLIYEDKATDKFFITSPNKQLIFNSNKKLTLLSIDRNDVIYIGELDGDKIVGIVYGKISEDTSSWKKIKFDSYVGTKNLYFNEKSEILINDNLKGSVKNLTTGNETEYEGKFIQIKEDFIATINNDGKLFYKALNK